jgi:hypothetical protein
MAKKKKRWRCQSRVKCIYDAASSAFVKMDELFLFCSAFFSPFSFVR